jgi:RNA polymerase sigma factor (sigma-70 family)
MGDEPEHSNPPDEGITALLAALQGGSPDAAWKTFVERYAPQIMHMVRQRQYTAQMADDCFLFVCERLSDDGFARLQQFDPARGVAFRGWLNAVTANLCVEWHRREFGRERIPPIVARLSAFDQRVFHFRYQQDLGLQACFELLRENAPDLTRETLSAALARVQNALTWRQRWSLLRQRGRHLSSATGQLSVFDLPDRGPDPEHLASIEERRARLRQALDRLSPDDRLLLRLRFGQDLSLEQVTRVAGLPNLHMARRRIEAALARLAEALPDDDIS